MRKLMKSFLILASVYGLLAVILGAFGAHALKDRLSPEQLVSWDTGVRYQMFHALALMLLVLLSDRGIPGLSLAAGCFAVGVVLFSGSIYLLCLGIGPRALLGPVTPLGGLSLIFGWLVLLIQVIRTP